MHATKVFAVAAALFCAGLPAVAAAQSEESAGIVTTVNGDATLIRAMAAARPVSLRMRDEIFARDMIHTQERSLVRVLLGGKALITVRELSVLTVTEEAGRVTVDLQSGKVGVAVVKSRMRPGEVIEIRSPNATAAVRGTVFVVEVDPVKAGPAAGTPTTTTRVHLFHGTLDVSARLDPAQPTVRLAEMQSVVVAGNALSSVRPISRAAVSGLTADLKPRQIQAPDAPSEFTGPLVAREQGRAVMLASALLAPPPAAPAQGATQDVQGAADGMNGTAANVTGGTAQVLDQMMDRLGLDGLDTTVNGLQNAVGSVGGAASGVGSGLGGAVSGVGTGLGGTLSGVGTGLGGTLSGVGTGLGGAVSGVGTGLGGTLSGVGSGLGGAVGGVGGGVSGAGGAVGGGSGTGGGLVGGLLGTVGGVVGGLGGLVGR